VTEIPEGDLHCASMNLGISNVRKVMAVYCENNTESIGSMHCGGKTGEIRVFGKAVRTRTAAPSFRKDQIEHCRSFQGKNSHNVVYMTEDICD